MKRTIRRQIDIALTGLGIGIIFTAVIMGGSLEIQMQLPLALLGVLLMEAGVWGLSGAVLPSERRYVSLREEGDNIINLIRELNAAALARSQSSAAEEKFEKTLSAMHESVTRMSLLAGKAGEQDKAEDADSETGAEEAEPASEKTAT